MDRKRKEEREGGREGGGEEGKDREREEGRKRRKSVLNSASSVLILLRLCGKYWKLQGCLFSL